MKRVIEIDEKTYNTAKRSLGGCVLPIITADTLIRRVAISTALDDVLDKIKAEISDVYENLDGYEPDSLGTLISKVDEIIDKYKESEGK